MLTVLLLNQNVLYFCVVINSNTEICLYVPCSKNIWPLCPSTHDLVATQFSLRWLPPDSITVDCDGKPRLVFGFQRVHPRLHGFQPGFRSRILAG